MFQLVRDVEVIFDRPLAAAGNDADIRQASLDGFFHAVLDQWLADNRQHLFWHGLGSRQKTGAVTGGGKQTFCDHCVLSGSLDR